MECKRLEQIINDIDIIPKEKGVYVLILFMRGNLSITVGKLGSIFFKRGYYAYVGSAFGGLQTRIKSHINKSKKFHWHVDYLLGYTKLLEICYLKTTQRIEDELACFLASSFEAIDRFGASDSKSCTSHLFFSSSLKSIKRRLAQYRLSNCN